jgi:hypothetical protein
MPRYWVISDRNNNGTGTGLNNNGLSYFVSDAGPLNTLGQQHEMPVPHTLKEGADSVGVPGAALRVYVNIGMFSEYWLTRHNPLIGLTPQQPFETGYAHEKSVFRQATEQRVGNIAAFFRKLQPFHLADAPGGKDFITSDDAVMTRGKLAFAESCACCHSSKQPPPHLDPRSAEGKAWFHEAVLKPDFLKDNFLSNERRHLLTTIETNSARAFDTNAKAGHIWDNFSSQIWRTQEDCTLRLRKEFVPEPLPPVADADGYLKIGIIPKGTPINLIANLEPDASQLVALEVSEALLTIHAHKLSPEASAKELLKAVPELLAANKCPDFVEDEGHYFGTDLPDADKRACSNTLGPFER